MIVHLCVPGKKVPTAGGDYKTSIRHCRNANTSTHPGVIIIKKLTKC